MLIINGLKGNQNLQDEKMWKCQTVQHLSLFISISNIFYHATENCFRDMQGTLS